MRKQPEVEGRVETTLEITGHDIHMELPVRIDYIVTAYDPGQTYGPPERCYPPEGNEIEILEVNLQDSVDHRNNNHPVMVELHKLVRKSAEKGDLADEIMTDAGQRREWLDVLEDEAREARLLQEAI